MTLTPGSSSRRYLGIVPALALVLAFVLAGCNVATQPEPTPTAPPAPTEDIVVPTATVAGGTSAPTATLAGGTGGIDSTQALIDALTKAGMTVTPTGPIEQPFLSVKGTSYEAGNGYLQVFEYPDQAAADADAAKISPDGSIEGYSVNWVASPHFYKVGRLIVIYLGDDPADLAILKSTLGEPFATAEVRRLP